MFLRATPSLFLLALSSTLLACGTPTEPNPICDEGVFFDGAPTESLVLGETVSGTFTPLTAGGDVRFVWGFQGGSMILLSIELQPSVAGSSRCVSVELENRADPAFPDAGGELGDFPGYTQRTELYEVDGVLRAVALDNQIGWGTPVGVQMILSATVRGLDYAASATLPLRIVDMDGFDM